jgi:Bacterial DNA-binding protein
LTFIIIIEKNIYNSNLLLNEEPLTMPLTKTQIVESIQNQTGSPKNKSSEFIEILLGIIKRTLVSGEDVMVSGSVRFV